MLGAVCQRELLSSWKGGGKPDRKRLTDAQMLALIKAIHAEHKGAYRTEMVKELRGCGFPCGFARLMRENGIHAWHKRRYKVMTDSKHSLPVVPNLAGSELHTIRPPPGLDIRHTYLWPDEDRCIWPSCSTCLIVK